MNALAGRTAPAFPHSTKQSGRIESLDPVGHRSRPGLSLSPQEHLRLLHPTGTLGDIALGPLPKTGSIHKLTDALNLAGQFAGLFDIYLSQQRFRERRRRSSLSSFGCCYADLDYHLVERWRDTPPELMTEAVLLHIEEHGIPRPSYILFTGRGLLAVWLHDHLKPQAEPRWAAVEKELVSRLAPFGADRSASDPARLFRLAGTFNSKSGEVVRPTFLPEATIGGARWCFDDLAHEVLPVERSVLKDRRACRKPRALGAGAKRSSTRRRDATTYWATVLDDLKRLASYRWPSGIPSGCRDSWMLIAGSALAWLVPEPQLLPECVALAECYTPWRQSELRNRLNTVLRRALQAKRGEKFEHAGKLVDPRYRIRAATIIEWLSITAVEMRHADLRVLVDVDVKRERERARGCRRRQNAGRSDRATYETAARERRLLVHDLRARGRTWRAIGQELSISESEARRLGGQFIASAGSVPVYGGLPSDNSMDPAWLTETSTIVACQSQRSPQLTPAVFGTQRR